MNVRVAASFVLHVILLFACCTCDAAENSSGASEAPRIGLQPLVRGLERPTFLTHDGTERLFVTEQRGRVRLIVDGKLLPTPYLDITDRVHVDRSECGLFSVVFHPQFATNGYLYVNYTAKKPRLVSVISEFTADPASRTVNPSTERVILQFDQPYPNHNGGQSAFGPDGMFYIGTGDGGSAGDPQDNAQNPRSWLGKMLRIDVNQRDPYGIPKDNPFVNDARYRPEIYATGLRNPWRFSFDRETGVCYAGDVGQNAYEEVDIITRGGNYGWRFREAAHPFKPDGAPPNLIDPIKEYGRHLGLSITGGYVYRGKQIPDLVGWYLYADYGSGRIWGLKYENGQVTADAELLKDRAQPASFGEDLAGELYICDHNGAIYKIVAK